MDPRSAGGQHWLCGGAVQEVPLTSGGAAEFPEDWAEPRNQERGAYTDIGIIHLPHFVTEYIFLFSFLAVLM